jgi:hypothetical protein
MMPSVQPAQSRARLASGCFTGNLVSRRTRNPAFTREQFRALLNKIKSEI